MSPLPGETGTLRLENLNVHHNIIRMLVGITGLASTAGNPETFTTWNNRFSDNTYFVPSDTGAWWFWDTNKMWTEWQAGDRMYGFDDRQLRVTCLRIS